MDAIVINPGGRELVYQGLGQSLTAIEPPLWARLITGYLLDRSWDIELLDTEALAMSSNQAAAYISNTKPILAIVVAFGHQPSASTQTMIPARELCKAIKAQAPDIPVLIVGGHVAALPERTLVEEPVDYCCSGEGPVTSDALLKALTHRSPLDQVAGLVWQDEFGAVRKNQAAPLIQDLDKELHGNVWHLLPMDRYRAHNWQCFGELESRQPYASIYTSLGCPYKCVFCCINAPFNESRYRCRSPQSVVDEIELLYREYGVKTFKIIDEMFVLKKTHYLKICELLAQKSFAHELNIWAYARVDTVREETLTLMRSAGIRWLALGIESADETVRDGANKSLNAEGIVEVVRAIQAADINVIGNFIFGLPHDSVESMEKTLQLALELKCEFVNFYSAMAYPGSRLYQDALDNNLSLPTDWSGYSQHSQDCFPLATEYETNATVLRFRDDAFHRYFASQDYLTFVEQKFGLETREHIEQMSEKRLVRDLFQETTEPMPPVVILAGGLGTRLRQALPDKPKVLAPVGNRPFLGLMLEWLSSQGVSHVVLSLGYLSEQVIEFLKQSPLPLKVDYVVEHKPLGTLGGCALAFDTLKNYKDIIVLNGDTFLDLDLAGFVKQQRNNHSEVGMVVAEVEEISRYGSVEMQQGLLTRFVEKQVSNGRGWINGGVYYVGPQTIEAIKIIGSGSIERDFFAENQLPVLCYPHQGMFIDIGTPDSFQLAQQLLMEEC